MKKIILAMIIGLVTVTVAQAQNTSQGQIDQPEDVLGYNPDIVLNDWKALEIEVTPENAFIEVFMQEHEVPTTGLFGFSKHDTWYWWISNNQDAILTYFQLREDNGLE
jgi:hypothetical protein